MNFEKLVNSKLYDVVEYIYRLLILNLINIFFLILIVPFLPSLTASFEVVKNIKNREYPFFRNYFKSFFKNFRDSFLYSLLFGIVFILIVISINYYYTKEVNNLATQFGFLFMVFMFIALFQVFIYMPIIIKDFYFFNSLQKIKFGFYFSMNNILQTILFDGLFILILLSILYVPLIFFMGEVAIFIIIVSNLSSGKIEKIRKIYEKNLPKEEKE